MRPSARILILALCVLLPSCGGKSLPVRDWDEIIASYRDDGLNVRYLDLAELNLALAETGRLADDMFKYTQAGPEGIVPQWNRSEEAGVVASDIYYSMGHIAYAQRMAFEADVLNEDGYNPRMVERLIQTNILFGAYPVAEKLIKVLEKDGYDCSRFRPFLYDDAAVDSDPILGPKRRCIPSEDHISLSGGIEEDLKRIIRINPSHRITLEYLGAIYLLDCDMEAFKALVDEFYGTEALPELHGAFAEAACMLSEVHHGYWKTVGVDKAVHNRYLDFTKRVGTGVSMDRFKDTFWYYIMRVNSL